MGVLMRIGRVLLTLGVVGMFGCSASSRLELKPDESIKEESVRLLRNLDAGDYMAMIAEADSNLVMMDFDENNAPFRANGLEEARAFMKHMDEASRSQGLHFESTVRRNDGWATPTMGYSIVEFDQTITAGGKTMGPFKFRGTLIARREGDRWVMTHWHGSFREAPEVKG